METMMTVKKDTIASLALKQDMGNVIKPLKKEVTLTKTYIAGLVTDPNVFTIGKKLKLVREESKIDRWSIGIYDEGGQSVGYIPEKDDEIPARLMDAGKLLEVRVRDIGIRDDMDYVGIEVYMMDF